MASVTLVSLTFEKVWDAPVNPFIEVIPPAPPPISSEQITFPEASAVSFPPFAEAEQLYIAKRKLLYKVAPPVMAIVDEASKAPSFAIEKIFEPVEFWTFIKFEVCPTTPLIVKAVEVDD